MKIKRLNILCILFLTFTIGACDSKAEVNEKTLTPTPTTQEIKTDITPTRMYSLYTPTPKPTLLPMQEQIVIETLNSRDCQLPCYLGISPQKTSVDEAKQILSSLGGRYTGIYITSTGLVNYRYSLNLSINSANSEYINSGILQSIDIYSLDGQIQAISVSISAGGSDAMAKALSVWSRYAVMGIFQELGAPDYLYLNPLFPPVIMNGRELLIGYESKGVIVDIYGSGEINFLCPQRDAEHTYLSLMLFKDYSFIEKYSSSLPMRLASDQNSWVPMEDELEITVDQFFSSVINNTVSCFVVKS